MEVSWNKGTPKFLNHPLKKGWSITKTIQLLGSLIYGNPHIYIHISIYPNYYNPYINQSSIYPYWFWGTLNHPLIGCPYHYINPNVPTFACLSTFHDGIPYGLRVIQSWKIPLSSIIRKTNLRRMSIIWLVVYLPLWKMMEWKSVGMMKFPISGKSWNSCSKPPTSSVFPIKTSSHRKWAIDLPRFSYEYNDDFSVAH